MDFQTTFFLAIFARTTYAYFVQNVIYLNLGQNKQHVLTVEPLISNMKMLTLIQQTLESPLHPQDKGQSKKNKKCLNKKPLRHENSNILECFSKVDQMVKSVLTIKVTYKRKIKAMTSMTINFCFLQTGKTQFHMNLSLSNLLVLRTEMFCMK